MAWGHIPAQMNRSSTPHVPPAVETTPWTARVEEAIGPIFAGRDARGALRVGGELMASRDRIAWLEARADAAHDDEVAAIVDEALSPPGVALFGVRRLPSIAEAIVHAKHAR